MSVRFEQQELSGLYLIHPERHEEERGFFARTYCRDTFLEHGLEDCSDQCSLSYNRHKETLRGLHFQRAPHQEAKLVRCSRGRVWDVAVDLRKDSSTFGQWFGVVLSQNNGLSLYVPKGFAHGFLTLEDESDVYYQMAGTYVPDSAAGVRWDDPALAISWPTEPSTISDRDRALPNLSDI